MHFWDRALMPYAWLHEVPSIWDRHTPENLLREAPGHLPEKIVFVECGAPWFEELKWVEQLASTESRIRGIVAKATVNAGAQTSADIAVLRQHPLVRGVRHHFEHEKDPGYCARPEFIRGVGELAAAGLNFDICCKHPVLPAVIELVRRCPEVQFILDHAGKPGIRAGLLDPWREHIRALAKLQNVVCKFPAWSPKPITSTGRPRNSGLMSNICLRRLARRACSSAATGRSPNWRVDTSAGSTPRTNLSPASPRSNRR